MTVRTGRGERTFWRAASIAMVAVTWAPSARAEEPAIIWYRSTSGCPSAAAFQAQVEQRGRSARIATAGDRVDFVVSLSQGESEAVGQLERQTDDGIVAIREVTGDTCDEVAEAIAFSLSLADQRRAAPATEAPPRPSAEAPAAAPTPAAAPRSSPTGDAERPGATSPEPRAAAATPRRRGLGEAWIDLSGAGRSAVAPLGAWGGAAAVSFEEVRLPWRFEAYLVHGGRTAERGDYDLTLWGGRLQVCPITLARSVRLAACAGLDLGELDLRGRGFDAVRSRGPWLAGTVEERLRWPADRPFALEGSLGAFAPLVEYRVVAENPSALLHRIDPVGLMASLGVALRLP